MWFESIIRKSVTFISLEDGRTKRRVTLTAILTAFILLISAWNAALTLRQYFHWPPLVEDEWTRLNYELSDAKTQLNTLPDRHIQYRVEEATNTYNTGVFFRLQYIVHTNNSVRIEIVALTGFGC